MQQTITEIKENQDKINAKIAILNIDLAANISKAIDNKFDILDNKISSVRNSIFSEIKQEIELTVPVLVRETLSEEREIERRKCNLIFYNIQESSSPVTKD